MSIGGSKIHRKPKVTIEQLFPKYDGKLRAVIAWMGIDDPMAQEDIAQDTWAKLVARRNKGQMPGHPKSWLRAVARRRVLEIIEREERMREWERTATERHQAAGRHPFRFEDAIAAVRTRLSNREQQILAASQRCQTSGQLARVLGYPTAKIANTARARVRKRLIRILGEGVDISFMFSAIPDVEVPKFIAETPETPDSIAEVDWDSTPEAEPRSEESERKVLERLRVIDDLASTARTQVETVSPLGSFANLFDRLLSGSNAGSEGDWAEALGLSPEDISELRSGDRTVLELDPGTVVMMSDMIHLRARDVALMGLGDSGLRPIHDDADLSLKEALLPSEEADFRVQAILAEAKAQETAM